MKKEINECDTCGNTTEDICNKIGWINIDSTSFSIRNGRDVNGNAKDLFWDGEINTSDRVFDFCCIACFLKYILLNNKKNEIPWQSNDPLIRKYIKIIDFAEKIPL